MKRVHVVEMYIERRRVNTIEPLARCSLPFLTRSPVCGFLPSSHLLDSVQPSVGTYALPFLSYLRQIWRRSPTHLHRLQPNGIYTSKWPRERHRQVPVIHVSLQRRTSQRISVSTSRCALIRFRVEGVDGDQTTSFSWFDARTREPPLPGISS